MGIRVLKNRQFARWAKRERLATKALCMAVCEIERGLIDARLGGFLLKKRIAQEHRGKSGGLRTILAYQKEGRLVFLFGFAKRERANIDETEKKALIKLAAAYMAMSETNLNDAIRKGKLLEVHCDDEEEEAEPDPRGGPRGRTGSS